MNAVQLIGNLCRDPELSYSAAGKAYMHSCLAVRRQRAREGQPDVDFINVTFFGKAAELVAQYLTKGSAIAVEGRLQIDVVEKDGGKRYYTKIPVDKFHFVGGKRKESGSEGPALPASQPGAGGGLENLDFGAPESPELPPAADSFGGGTENEVLPAAPDLGDGPVTEMPW
jgi:single-strand DNA-binding protein